jgi:hypothetical protein
MLHALGALAALVLGWLVQAVDWSLCYAENSYDMPVCPEWRLAHKFSGGMALARIVFAIMLGLLYFAYVVITTIAVNRTRKPDSDGLDGDDKRRMAD